MSPNQPRTPDGRYWFTNKPKGWYEYTTKSGEIKHFYHNNEQQMSSGFAILAMASQGKVYEPAGGKPYERIHMTSTEDGEMHMYAASHNGAFGVVNHSQEGPVGEFSCIRGHEYLPVSDKLPEDNTAFGGRMAKDSGMGRPIIDASRNEQVNREAFEAEDARIFHINPHDLAQAQVDARHEYQRMGLTEGQARHAPVYVYMDKDGTPKVIPVYAADDFGGIIKRQSPNPHGGTHAVMLDGDDVTRMSRAMEREGLDDVQVTVSQGTTARHNALHFRADYENRTTRDSGTMWGSVEANNSGTVELPSVPAAHGGLSYDVQSGVIHYKAAEKFHNPASVEDATRLLRHSYQGKDREPRYIRQEDVELRNDRILLHDAAGDKDEVYDLEGNHVGFSANTVPGFTSVFNANRPEKARLDDRQVTRLDDGYFRVDQEVRRDDGSIGVKRSFWRPTGEAVSPRIARRRYGEDVFDM